MKLHKNVLTENTLEIINREFNNFMQTPENWSSSTFEWSEGIKRNISGPVLIKFLSDGCRSLVLEEIQKYIPTSVENVVLKYYVWTPNSGISDHTDGVYKFGATIYLNESWDVNDGGIFLYQHDVDDWRAHVPTFNTMVVNDSRSLHLVTPVSAFARHNRYTIQIFGERENE